MNDLTRGPEPRPSGLAAQRPGDELPGGVEDAAAASLVIAVDGDMDRARALWAFAHGMITLELAQRFPPDADLDAVWTTGLDRLASPTAPDLT